MSKVWKENIKSESFWLRSLFMILFLIVYRIVDLVVLLIAVCQWLFVLITGDANSSLTRFSASLGQYVAQIINYLGHESDEKPFPFSDWPEDGVDTKAEPKPESEPTEPAKIGADAADKSE